MPRRSLPLKIFGLLLLVTAVACFGLSQQTSVPGQHIGQGESGATFGWLPRQEPRYPDIETKLTVVDRAGYFILGIVFSVGALCCFAGARIHRSVKTLTKRR